MSREERFFCARLYESMRHDIHLSATLNSIPTPGDINYFANKKILSTEQQPEIAFEVCFYRDFQYYMDWNLKDKGLSKRTQKNPFSPKRTFDLCFFSEKEIILIEAKVYSPLTSSQNKSFLKDKEQIPTLFKDYGITNIPRINLVLICSSAYYRTPTFDPRRKKHIGFDFITEASQGGYLAQLWTWKDMAELYHEKLFKTADEMWENNSKNQLSD